ncbi:hypothetical protein LTR66_014018 [Elasticomyces elasticus]|nr:hypothetical protein LTR66_014018 [Elasticomyces elasticus]
MAAPVSAPIGYGAIATGMNDDPDLAIYRRFGVLNARNLLHLQSELMTLEDKLQQLDTIAKDITRGNEVWSLPRSWYYLERAGGERLDLVRKIRDTLERYNRALESQAWLLNLKRPTDRPLTNLSNFMALNRSEISTIDAQFILERHRLDLIALAEDDKELMSRFLEKYFFHLFKSKVDRMRSQNGPLGFYSANRVRSFVRLLAVIGSSILPILSTVVLYNIPSQQARLGCIVAFSALCSAILSVLTNAKNVEVIAATAA